MSSPQSLAPAEEDAPPSPQGRSWAVAAIVLMVLVGWRTDIQGGVRIGDVVALMALPVTWRAARYSKVMGAVMIMSALAVGTGLAMSYALADQFSVASATRRGIVLAAIAIPAGACAFAWAKGRVGMERAAVALCCGLLLDAVQRASSLDNPWKFALGLPVSVLVLAASHRFGRLAQILAVGALAAVYLLNDSRSAVGFLVVTGAILVLQSLASWLRLGGRPRTVLTVQAVTAVGLSAAAITAVLAASSSGLLGQAAQARTLAQADGTENVLVAARPEMGATISLIHHRVWGYGAGVAPNYSDIRVAMQGMSTLSYNPDNSYVQGYMLSSAGFELHSGLADLWVTLSIPGLVLGLFIIGACFIALGRNLTTLRSRAWLILVVIVVVWNSLFGPLNGVVGYMELALGTAITLPSVALQERAYRTVRGRHSRD